MNRRSILSLLGLGATTATIATPAATAVHTSKANPVVDIRRFLENVWRNENLVDIQRFPVPGSSDTVFRIILSHYDGVSGLPRDYLLTKKQVEWIYEQEVKRIKAVWETAPDGKRYATLQYRFKKDWGSEWVPPA